jgi:hypothetical protein
MNSCANLAMTLSLATFGFVFMPPLSLHAGESDGSVCLVSYAPKVMSYDPKTNQIDEFKRVFIMVDHSERLSLEPLPRLIVEGLRSDVPHKITIFYDGKVVESWKFKFSIGKAPMVNLWRSAGYWHTEPNSTGTCSSGPLTK